MPLGEGVLLERGVKDKAPPSKRTLFCRYWVV